MAQNQYLDPAFPGSLGGFHRFYRALKKSGYRGKKKTARDFFSHSKPYTHHYPVRKNFPRNKIIVNGIDDTWQMDLADMQSLSQYNDGYKYLLICIDVFSKFVAIEPTKDKTGISIELALREIFNRTQRKPKQIQSDEGTEFLNAQVQRLMNQENIKHYVTKSDKKACVVERVIRTFKERMHRYFTARNTSRYIDDLQNFVIGYNSS
jgi:hypothetical protein